MWFDVSKAWQKHTHTRVFDGTQVPNRTWQVSKSRDFHGIPGALEVDLHAIVFSAMTMGL